MDDILADLGDDARSEPPWLTAYITAGLERFGRRLADERILDAIDASHTPCNTNQEEEPPCV